MQTSYFDIESRGREQEKAQVQLMQLVGFRIGKELFGVDILMVQEIIRKVPITSVPNAPDFIEGVINLRGGIIPIIDLRKRLRLPTLDQGQNAGTRILIVTVDSRTTGFIVDSVTKVMKIQTSDIEPPPEIVVAGLKSKYISGVCKIDGNLLILLDFSQVLLIREKEQLKGFESGPDA
jgi:purine-binding chemotaxis protein CheW